jgi:hypothetical protein
MVARGAGSADARLLPRRGRRGPALLAVPPGALRPATSPSWKGPRTRASWC